MQAISEELSARGHEVMVATSALSGEVGGNYYVNGVRILRFPTVGPSLAYQAPRGLLSYLLETRHTFDLVHAHNYHALMLPAAALSRPARLVMTPHLNDRAHSRTARLLHAPYAVVGRWSLAQADRVICVSQGERQRLATRFRLPAHRLSVIPNGVDIEHLQSTVPGERREDDLLLAVSRLESYKRVDLAIETLAALPQHYRLVIVGHGPLRRRLAELASSRGVSGRTVFLGAVGDDDLMRWYRRASVLLNLSEAEAFGLTVLESIAAGCRAVCSAIPAFRELEATFPDHIAVTSAPDPRAVAATVMSFSRKPMVSSPDLARFSWSAAVDQLLALYQELLEPHPGHPLPTAHNRVRQKEGMRP